MPNIKLKDKNGNDVVYEGIETVTFDTDIENTQAIYTHGVALENMEIPLELSEGDMELNAPNGYLVKNAIIKKPTTLSSENIKNGVEIAGVTGNFIGDYIENVPIPLYLADGDQVIEAPNGYLVKSAIIQKPQTLIAENIAKDIEIAGVVGTLESGGGGVIVEKDVNFFDYDGTLLYSYTLAEARALSSLPPLPSHDRLVCEGWTHDLSDLMTNTRALDIGALYHTVSGATELDIELTKAIGLTLSFGNQIKTDGFTSIDWGDGTINTQITHTYTNYGDYTIKIYGITQFSGSSAKNIFYADNYSLKRVFLSQNVVAINDYAFGYCYFLKEFTMSNSVNTALGNNAFINCYLLNFLALSNNIHNIGNTAFRACQSLKNIVLPKNLITITGECPFYYCYSLKRVVFPNSLTSITGIGIFMYSYVEHVIMPSEITELQKQFFMYSSNVRIIDFSEHKSVPTLANTNAIYVRPFQKFLVPSTLYNEWIATTGWSNHTNYIYAV